MSFNRFPSRTTTTSMNELKPLYFLPESLLYPLAHGTEKDARQRGAKNANKIPVLRNCSPFPLASYKLQKCMTILSLAVFPFPVLNPVRSPCSC